MEDEIYVRNHSRPKDGTLAPILFGRAIFYCALSLFLSCLGQCVNKPRNVFPTVFQKMKQPNFLFLFIKYFSGGGVKA